MSIIVGAAGGVMIHTLVPIHGKWHLNATKVLQLFTARFFPLAVLEVWYSAELLFAAPWSTSALPGVFFADLFASIVTYRLFFHRLRHFPGPTLAKACKLWHVTHCLDSKNHLLMDRLHQKYGDFVRKGV